MDDIDDKELDYLLAENRHREVIDILNKILSKLLEPKNTEVNVEVDTTKLEKILEKINTSPDLSSIPNSIKALGNVISKKLEQQKYPEPVKKWKHTIKRDSQGLYKEIISEALNQ